MLGLLEDPQGSRAAARSVPGTAPLSGQDPRAWLQRFPAASPCHDAASKVLEESYHWFLSTGLGGTPALFLNGRQVPSSYGYDELFMYLHERARAQRSNPHNTSAA